MYTFASEEGSRPALLPVLLAPAQQERRAARLSMQMRDRPAAARRIAHRSTRGSQSRGRRARSGRVVVAASSASVAGAGAGLCSGSNAAQRGCAPSGAAAKGSIGAPPPPSSSASASSVSRGSTSGGGAGAQSTACQLAQHGYSASSRARDDTPFICKRAQRPVIRSVRRQRVGRALRRARRRGAGGVAHVLSRREVCGGKVEVIAREGHRKQQ